LVAIGFRLDYLANPGEMSILRVIIERRLKQATLHVLPFFATVMPRWGAWVFGAAKPFSFFGRAATVAVTGANPFPVTFFAVAFFDTTLEAEAFFDTTLEAEAFFDTTLEAVAFFDTTLEAEAFFDTTLEAVAFFDTTLEAVAFFDTTVVGTVAAFFGVFRNHWMTNPRRLNTA
jgi:hypothetical protein